MEKPLKGKAMKDALKNNAHICPISAFSALGKVQAWDENSKG